MLDVVTFAELVNGHVKRYQLQSYSFNPFFVTLYRITLQFKNFIVL
jgi:hypothetical protein